MRRLQPESGSWSIVVLITAYAIVLGSLTLGHSVVADHGDPIEYMEGARNLLAYDSPYHPPLYSAMIAVFNILVKDLFAAAKLASFLASIVLVLLTWMLGRVCFRSETVGLVSAILVALSPTIVKFAYRVDSDMLGAALFLASIYCLAKAGHGSRWPLIAAGVVAGLAYLTRYVYVSMVPAALIYLSAAVPRGEKGILSRVLHFLLPFLVVIAPWTIICLVRHGDLHNVNHVNVAFAIFDTRNSWLLFAEYGKRYPTLVSLLVDQPVAVVRHLAKNVFHFPAEVVVRYGLLAGVFATVGGIGILRRPTVERVALILNGASLVLVTLLTWFEERFFVPIVPLVMLCGTYVVTNRLGDWVGPYWPTGGVGASVCRRLPLAKPALLLTLTVAMVFGVRQVPIDYANSNIDDEKRAGEFIKHGTPEDTQVLTSSRNLAWYANRPYVPMTMLGPVAAENLEGAVFATSARVIVYTKRHSIYTHPQLEYLLNPEDTRIPGSFRLFYRSDGIWPVVAYWVEPRVMSQNLSPRSGVILRTIPRRGT